MLGAPDELDRPSGDFSRMGAADQIVRLMLEPSQAATSMKHSRDMPPAEMRNRSQAFPCRCDRHLHMIASLR